MNNEGHNIYKGVNTIKKNKFSFTPSPGKKQFVSKFPLDDMDEFDEIISKPFGKLSNTNKVKSNLIKDNESLFKKMPNFLKNYDDLIDIIKIDSKDKLDKPAAKIPEIFGKTSNIEELVSTKERKVIENLSAKEKIVQNLTNSEDIKDFYASTEECLKRIAALKIPDIATIEHLRFDLPFEEELKIKKLAIFDLDETLVRCEAKKPKKGKVQINIKLPNGEYAMVINTNVDWPKHTPFLERMS
jgi:hypothetical protein